MVLARATQILENWCSKFISYLHKNKDNVSYRNAINLLNDNIKNPYKKEYWCREIQSKEIRKLSILNAAKIEVAFKTLNKLTFIHKINLPESPFNKSTLIFKIDTLDCAYESYYESDYSMIRYFLMVPESEQKVKKSRCVIM